MRLCLIVAILAGSTSAASAKPSKTCVILKIMESLASAEAALSDEETAMIRTARRVRCATADEEPRWDWPNGTTAKSGDDGYWQYPDGTTARSSGDDGYWQYPSGTTARSSGDAPYWQYANGTTARASEGSYYQDPSGTTRTEQELLTLVCELDDKHCGSNLKTYRLRKGDSRYAWLFSTVYRLWKQAGN